MKDIVSVITEQKTGKTRKTHSMTINLYDLGPEAAQAFIDDYPVYKLDDSDVEALYDIIGPDSSLEDWKKEIGFE